MAGVLPSSNLIRSDGTPPHRAFREEVDALFRHCTVEGRSLLDVLLEVEAERDDVADARRHARDARAARADARRAIDEPDGDFVPVGTAGAPCPACGEALMATDALRVHETFNEHGSNLEACSRVMSVAERLILLAARTSASPASLGARRRWRSSPTGRSRCSARSRRSNAPCFAASSESPPTSATAASACR